MFLLNCIHDDLNERAEVRLLRESFTGKGLEEVKNLTIAHHTKHNKSIITDNLVGFHS